jgi:hypothetical protein
MNAIMNKFLPSIAHLFKYLNYIGLVKIFVYFLCVSVLLFIVYKLFKLIMGAFDKSSTILLDKKIICNKENECLSSFESKSTDFDLEPKKKIIHIKSSSYNKKDKKNKIKNLIKSELLLSSSF